MTPITQADINKAAWSACDTFRGVVDPSIYKDYVLTMLFLKYLSDVWKDHLVCTPGLGPVVSRDLTLTVSAT